MPSCPPWFFSLSVTSFLKRYGLTLSPLKKKQDKSPIDLKTFRSYLKEDMAPYKVPSILKIVDSIERNAMGKVNKKQVLKRYFEPAQ